MRYSSLRGCSARSASPQIKIHRRSTARNFQTGSFPGDFIVGTGEWRLHVAPGGTRVAYALDVVATGRLAVLLGWLLPLGKIHSKFMREVLENLERETTRRVSSPVTSRG